MVDFEGGKRGGFDRDDSVSDALQNGSSEYQDSPASASAGSRILVADANGVVNLPAGTSLQDFVVQGRDLVIKLADGSTIIIPDGAINTPQIVIDGNAVPPMVVSAYLNGLPLSPEDEGFNPDALPAAPPSSGGEFDDGQLFLQDAFDLGNLLPYTELGFEPQPEEEIIPFANEKPDVVIETPDNPIGVENAIAIVAERGLPERGDPAEPEGTADETNAETTTGTIVFNAPDGLRAIILNGEEITTVGQQFVTPFGTLTITSIDLASGEIGFSYTLADNLLGLTEDGNFFVTVIDRDGDTADASLRILVEDDSPIAADDIGIVPGGTFGPITGNVLDNDESGADDYPVGEEGPDAVTGFASVSTGGAGDPGDSVQGEYGVLTLNADGTYSYVRDYNTPGGVTEDFTYTIIDQDGSTSTATLTINIDDAPNTIEIPDIGEGTVVDEGGLAPRDGEPVGTGEGADGDPANDSDPSEGTGSTITFNSPDGLGSITIAGVEVNLDNLAGNDADDQVIVDDATGKLVITAVTYDPVTGDGSITYEYTLADNTSGDDTSVSFEVVVTDLDDDVASDDLVITIIDDEPLAAPDTDSVKEDGPLTATGNVITDAEANGDNGADTVGADDADVTGVIFGTSTDPVSGGVGAEVDGNYGTLVLDADGNYTYTLDNDNVLVQGLDSDDSFTETFTYTLTDGDGDPVTTTLTITINGNDDPVVIEGLDLEVPEVSVDEDDLPAGTDTTKESLTQPEPDGTFTFKSVDGLVTLQIGSKTFTAAELLDAANFPTTVTGDYGTLTVQGVSLDLAPDGSIIGGTITYDYTLSQNTLDHDQSGEDDVIDDFLVRIEDTDGSFDEASLDVQVVDDIPLAGDNAEVQLDDDALSGNPGGTGDVDPDSDNLTGTLAHNFGADGAGTIDFASMNGQSVEINGVTVTFTWAGDTLTANDGTNDVFTVQVNSTTGEYTVTQLAPLDHHLTGDDVETDASFVLTYTVTDGDNDFTTGTLTVNLNDDTPEFGEAEGSAPTLVTDDTLTEGGSDSDSASFAGAFAPLFGADGQAASDALVYSLAINGDDGTDSLLNDAVTDENILLRVSASDPNVIEAYLETSGDIAFTLTLDPATGEITQEQFRAIEHDNPDDPVESGAEAESMAADLISLTATITDGDDDQASQSIDIGDSFTFTDDGPQFGSRLVLARFDEDEITDGNGDSAPGDGPSVAGNSATSVFVFDFGADGPNADELTVSVNSVTTSGPSIGAVTLMSGGEVVNYSWDASTNTLTGYTSDVNDPVFTLSFSVETNQVTFTLLQPLDHPSTDADGANDGPELGYEDNLRVNFDITITDGDGDSVDTTLAIEVDDDMAVAFDNSASLGEGDDVSGNVVTDSDISGTDSAGADGYADAGPVVDADFSSANQGITLTSKSVDPTTGTITIVTSAGTLTVETDGSYTFESDANSINGNAQIIFSYTIEDGDGDQATADLTIDITNVGGTATAGDLLVDEKGLSDGTGELADLFMGVDPNPISDQSEIDSGSIIVSGGSGTLTYQLVGGTFDDGGTVDDPTDDTYSITTAYGTIVLDAFTGEYTYTLNEEYDHDAPVSGADRNTAPDVESFDYVVVDELDNVIVDSRDPGGDPIKVSIVDDIPEVDLNTTGDNPDAMLTFDEQTVGGTSTDTADFSTSFNVDSFLYGADGAGMLDTTYALVFADTFVEGSESGLTSDDAPVYIWLVDGTIVGTTSNVEPADLIDTTDFVFTLSVGTDSGIVTLTQYAELDHSDTDTAPAYDGDTIPLPGGIVEVEATATIVDFDGDTVTDSASVDLGDYVEFADDGPHAAISSTNVSVTHDETPGDDVDADDTSDEDIIALFSGVTGAGTDPDMPAGYATSATGLSSDGSDFGADGEGDVIFSLGVSSDGVDSGLDVTGGGNILLYKEGDLIVGRVGGSTGDAAFAIAIDPDTGVISVVQYLSIDHPTGGASHDESLSIANGALLGVVTVTDEEGDSDTESLGIGNLVSFEDDGPSVSAVVDSGSTVTVDETDLAQGAATIDLDGKTQGNDGDVTGSPTIVGSSTGTGNGVLDITPDFGADGELAGGGIDYDLVIGSSTSGLTTTDGTAINLVAHSTDSDVVLGVVEGTNTVAFAISIDSTTGELTVEQYVSIAHGDTDDHNDPEQLLTGSLLARVTVTDGDDDTASSSDVDITSLITFRDDGPAIEQNGETVDMLVLDESPAGQDEGGNNDPAGRDSISADFSDNFDAVFGVDGAGVPDVAYALLLNGLASGDLGSDAVSIGSGLYALDAGDVLDVADDLDGIGQGSEIMLEFDGTDIVGVANGTEYFRISVDSDGMVTFSQSNNIWHGNTGSDDDIATLTTATADLIQLQGTAKDGDGDTAEASINLGANVFKIEDDGPSTSANAAVQLDDDDLSGGNDGGPGDVDSSLVLTGTLGLEFGTDGAGSVDFAVMDGTSVSVGGVLVTYSWSALTNTLTANDGTNDVFSVQVDPATGDYTVAQLGALHHHLIGDDTESNPEFALTYTVTDADGDSETGTFTVKVNDDTPEFGDNVSAAPTLVTDDTNIPDTDDSGNDFSGLFNPLYGADGQAGVNPITYAFELADGPGTDSGLDDSVTGDNILLRINGDVVEGYLQGDDTVIAFTLTIQPDGTIDQQQLRAIFHGNVNDPIESGAEAESISSGAIKLTATITDGDGDSVTSDPVDIGASFTFTDDGPSLTLSDPLQIDNDLTPSGSGTLAIDVGSDWNSDFDDIDVSNFTASVNGSPASNVVLTPGVEDATTASYTFSFDYPTGTTGTATAEGTLVFNKDTGTYEVTLTNGPINGFTIDSTSDPDTVFTEVNPNVTVAMLDTDLFAQFTAVAEPGAGTGDDNLFTTVNADGDDLAWEAGELFDQTATTVQVSSTAAGVAGNTIQGGEVLDFNLYASNPGGTTGGFPTTSATDMFLKFDTVGTSEDMIVVLKLWNDTDHNGVIDSTDEFTTRALMIQNSDIIKSGPLPEPYSAITLDNNDGIIFIESNDYNGVGETYQIVGAQIVGSDEGVVGSAINFNSATGVGGASNVDDTNTYQDFSTDVDDGPFKITSIGFVRTNTTDQTATIEFDVKVTDADGDSVTQTDVAVTFGDFPDGAPPIVLDLAGDGANAFVGIDANIAYDYDGDGVKTQTAWIAAGAAILVYDANSNGVVDDASEFVFGDSDTTDLQALLAMGVDTNFSFSIDSVDTDYGKFGVWLDDGDAVFEAGEFQTLEQAGIESVQLVETNIGGEFADGDVTVHNTVNFTYTDGNTGTAYDAEFALGEDVPDAPPPPPEMGASLMDVLLELTPDNAAIAKLGDIASEKSGRELPEATEIVKDVLAENVVDAMLDAISGHHGGPSAAAEAGSPIAAEALNAMLHSGAVAFQGNMMADLHEDAAALAVAHA